MTEILLLLGAILLVAFGGLMAAIDAAFAVTSRQDLVDLSDHGRNRAQLARIADDPDAHVNAVDFIRVLAETAAAVLVTASFVLLFGNIWWSLLAAVVLMTGISFVAVGASPRSVGRKHAAGLLRSAAPVIRGVRIILGPLAYTLVRLSSRVTPGGARSSSFDTEQQLLSMVDEAASQDLIEEDDRELIHSVFDFTDTYVRALMVPRTDMVTVASGTSAREALEVFLEKGVSRVPVMHPDGEEVDGVLYLKDLVQFAFRDERAWSDLAVDRIARPPVFVPESMRAERLLQQMRSEAIHVCLVIDEYGGVSGLITLEDLIEELVGDISDEYDARASEVVEVSPGRYRVSARLPLDEAGELFGLEVDDDDVDSVGGMLAKALGRIPLPGSTADVDGLRLTGGALRGRGRGLATVFVERAPEAADVDGTDEQKERSHER